MYAVEYSTLSVDSDRLRTERAADRLTLLYTK